MCSVDNTTTTTIIIIIIINNTMRGMYTKMNYRFVSHKYDKDRPAIEPDIWGQRPAAYCRQVTQ
jgi:hypothetical protein